MECSTNISSPSNVLLTNRLEYKDWSGKPRFVGRNPRFPERFFSSVATTAFSCLVFLSHSLPLARALEFSSSFPFGFPFCSRFVALPPCFVFHHVTSRPLLFVYFFSRHLLHLDAGMNCGSDMFLSFAVFSQSSIFEPSYAVYMFQFRFVRNFLTQRKRAWCKCETVLQP